MSKRLVKSRITIHISKSLLVLHVKKAGKNKNYNTDLKISTHSASKTPVTGDRTSGIFMH